MILAKRWHAVMQKLNLISEASREALFFAIVRPVAERTHLDGTEVAVWVLLNIADGN